MSAVAIDETNLYLLERAKKPTAEKLEETTAALRKLTFLVKSSWSDLSENQKDFLKVWLYAMVSPDEEKTTHTLRRAFWSGVGIVYTVILLLRVGPRTFGHFYKEVNCLIDAMMDAIERENEHIQRDIQDALAGDMKKADFKPGGAREWLDSL